ncbi:MAG TPA: peptidylprolyl isomerase [Ilumatobacter sp.]|nr:peptidylprolyl isomerase [Ilumatobacter sp.]
MSVVVAAVGVALFGSGCGSVSDGDVVARVDDSELDRDAFTELVNEREAADPNALDAQNDPDRASGETARAIAGQYVTLELVRLDLQALGVPVPAVDSSLTGAARFDAEYQTVGQTWVQQGSEVLGDETLRAWYDEGPSKSGVACVQHILVAEESEAQAVLDRLDGGEAFGDVAAETSLDTQSSVQGGSLGCQPLPNFSETFIPEFVDGSLDAEVGVPTQPVESEFGQHVIRITPFDELSNDDVLLTRLVALGQWHDVETDPEIGAWEWLNVAPLG